MPEYQIVVTDQQLATLRDALDIFECATTELGGPAGASIQDRSNALVNIAIVRARLNQGKVLD